MNDRRASHFDSWLPYAAILAVVGGVLTLFPLRVGSIGTNDFIQYWSAWKLMSSGHNPYDPRLLYETQAALASNPHTLMFSWNPPWSYTLLAPFVSFPFSAAATLWCFFQVAALLLIMNTAPRALRVCHAGLLGGVFAVFFFTPSLYSLKLGQTGILFALSLTCFLAAVNSHRYFLAGISLLPLSLKPHLFYLFVIPGVVWLTQIPWESAKRFLAGALGGFIILVVATLVVEPSSVSWWIGVMTAPKRDDPYLVHFEAWETHTIASAIRILVRHLSGALPSWPIIAVPLTSFTLTSLYFWRLKRPIDWTTLLPPLLCLSLGTSSYGWIFDQSALVLCQYLIVAKVTTFKDPLFKVAILLALISLQVVPMVLITTTYLPLYSLFVVPWFLLAILLIVSWKERYHSAPPLQPSSSS